MNPAIKIAIKSCHKHAARRQAQLDTWLKDYSGDFFFLVGKPCEPARGLEKQYLDTLWCSVSDEFANIAPKVLLACQYALSENAPNLLVIDDDTYLRPERITADIERFDCVGFVRTQYDVPYMQGSCFLLSARAMQAVVKHADLMVNGVPDDIAVGRCLYAERIPFVHEHRFVVGDPLPSRLPHATNDVIACHKCLPDGMPRVHEQWLLSQKSR
jgi:Galactosyltransferase